MNSEKCIEMWVLIGVPYLNTSIPLEDKIYGGEMLF